MDLPVAFGIVSLVWIVFASFTRLCEFLQKRFNKIIGTILAIVIGTLGLCFFIKLLPLLRNEGLKELIEQKPVKVSLFCLGCVSIFALLLAIIIPLAKISSEYYTSTRRLRKSTFRQISSFLRSSYKFTSEKVGSILIYFYYLTIDFYRTIVPYVFLILLFYIIKSGRSGLFLITLVVFIVASLYLAIKGTYVFIKKYYLKIFKKKTGSVESNLSDPSQKGEQNARNSPLLNKKRV